MYWESVWYKKMIDGIVMIQVTLDKVNRFVAYAWSRLNLDANNSVVTAQGHAVDTKFTTNKFLSTGKNR